MMVFITYLKTTKKGECGEYFEKCEVLLEVLIELLLIEIVLVLCASP